MGWGSEWKTNIEAKLTDVEAEQLKKVWENTKADIAAWPKLKQNDSATFHYVGESQELKYVGTVDLPKEAEMTKHEFKNKFPTHDPYTNPNAYLYYECDCGQVLDPKVKSFASLNNHASEANWKIRWGAKSYVPYCPKCVILNNIE